MHSALSTHQVHNFLRSLFVNKTSNSERRNRLSRPHAIDPSFVRHDPSFDMGKGLKVVGMMYMISTKHRDIDGYSR